MSLISPGIAAPSPVPHQLFVAVTPNVPVFTSEKPDPVHSRLLPLAVHALLEHDSAVSNCVIVLSSSCIPPVAVIALPDPGPEPVSVQLCTVLLLNTLSATRVSALFTSVTLAGFHTTAWPEDDCTNVLSDALSW